MKPKSRYSNLLSPGRIYLGTAVTFLVISLMVFNYFATWVETRAGVHLIDPVLNLFEAKDATFFIFFSIYGALLAAIVFLRKNPKQLAKLFLSYAILIWIRIVAMYLTPLDPPTGMILLRDPFVEWFGSGSRVLTRDLFFSGHTSLAFLFAFTASSVKKKIFFLVNALLLAFFLLAQKVHYSIDVFAAPFFAWTAFTWAGVLERYFNNLMQDPN